MKSKLRKTLFPLQFAIVGFILTMNGYLIVIDRQNSLGWWVSFLGILAIGYFIYIKKTRKNVALLEAFVFLIQGVALVLLGMIEMDSGKKWLPYPSFLAGVGYFVASAITFFRIRKATKKSIPVE